MDGARSGRYRLRMAGAKQAAIDKLTFEQAIERLEAIIARVESGQAPLDESLAAAEEGAKLIRRCRTILGAAEQRVRELSLDALEKSAGEAEPSGERDGA